jgi:hypothetical protein
MSMLTNPTQIATFRYCTLLRGLGLEIKGMKMSRGISMYAIIKKELGLKGTKTDVYNDLAMMLGKPTI